MPTPPPQLELVDDLPEWSAQQDCNAHYVFEAGPLANLPFGTNFSHFLKKGRVRLGTLVQLGANSPLSAEETSLPPSLTMYILKAFT